MSWYIWAKLTAPGQIEDPCWVQRIPGAAQDWYSVNIEDLAEATSGCSRRSRSNDQ